MTLQYIAGVGGGGGYVGVAGQCDLAVYCEGGGMWMWLDKCDLAVF